MPPWSNEIFVGSRSLTFVLGTDTGVGKTRLMALLAGVAPRPETVCLVKAVQTGVPGGGETGTSRDIDSYRGRGPVSRVRTWEGYSFSLPIDPMTAAASEGSVVDPTFLADKILEFYRNDTHVLVEGSGGVLSPFFQDGSGILTLMKALDHPVRVLLVAHPHLGTLSQVLSATRILVEEDRTPSAIVLFPRPGETDEATKRNPGTLRALLPNIPVILLD